MVGDGNDSPRESTTVLAENGSEKALRIIRDIEEMKPPQIEKCSTKMVKDVDIYRQNMTRK